MSSSTVRRADWKALAPAPLPGPTFAGQQKLPKLPVPALDQTLERLKKSLQPIAWTPAEYDAAISKIDSFARGIGPQLQERLLTHSKTTEHWLEEWWDRGAYLTYRDSVVVNVSYYYGFQDLPAHPPQSAVSRAAALIRSAALFRQQFKLGQLPPEATKAGPLCMDTWRWMFDCCRVPGIEGADWSVTHAKAGDIGVSGHIVVLRRGRFWRVDLSRNGQLVSTSELEAQIKHIVENTTEEYPGVGTLTASNRDVWAKDYQHLRLDPHNSRILDEIESASFVVCLDTEQPSGDIEFSRSLWHGTVSHAASGQPLLGHRNRWVDKPIQLIVFDNGKVGIMGEHSVMDGTPTVTFCDQVYKTLAKPTFDHGSSTGPSAPKPIPLDFNVSPQTKSAIAKATDAALELVESQAMSLYRSNYGKAAIKRFGISPDSWAQMIVQVAYGRLLHKLGQKRNGGAYEAATTRKFYKGRTEVVRVVTSESDAFVQAMMSPSVSVSEKRRLLSLAAAAHVSLAKDAGNAQGVDRHMLGLKKVMKPEEATQAEVFDDAVVKRSSNWVLSTSAIFSSTFDVYGWGEVVPEGFGVAYMTGFDDYLQYTITSRRESPNAEFIAEIKKAAEDMYNLFEEKARL